MQNIELPHGNLPVSPAEVWSGLSPEHQASTIRLLSKLAYEVMNARRKQLKLESDDELPGNNE